MTSNSSTSHYLVVCVIILLACVAKTCYGGSSGTFGFDIHHRYSEHVKALFNIDDLPEKGSPEYYEAMVHNDRFLHSRRLSDTTRLTFIDGNATRNYASLGFLYYANISVGTPSVSFLVALDTGSNLLWLPCDCTSCVRLWRKGNGEIQILNIYSPRVSSTSTTVPCSSPLCERKSECSSAIDSCPYKVSYITSSSGVLVGDLLHLKTDLTSSQTPVDASITFGCGKVQTGSARVAPNGLFGLGVGATSVPTMLAAQGLTSNSFSMCFGRDRMGRITFGDKGGIGQGETPFNLEGSHPTYNVSATQITVGAITTNHRFNAIFDTGTAFTYLSDPTYTTFTANFNSQIKEKRRLLISSNVPFEFCYDIGPSQTSVVIPQMTMTMEGGDSYSISGYDSIETFSFMSGQLMYCLAILKSEDIDIIGQNFMTEYRVVFDSERKKLGWKKSDCNDVVESNMTPTITPTASPSPSPIVPITTTVPIFKDSPPPPPPPPGASNSSRLSQFLAIFTMLIIFPLLAFV